MRENLARKLEVSRDTLYVVNVDHGILWEDNKGIRDLSADTLSLMIVLDENRMKPTDDGRPDTDDSDDDFDEEEEECKHEGIFLIIGEISICKLRFFRYLINTKNHIRAILSFLYFPQFNM